MTPDGASYKKSSFGPAFLFLDKRRRAALASYYAFCRLMDDVADEPGVQDRAGELAFWRAEVLRAFEGKPQTDLGREICQISRGFGMEQDRFLLLIEGMEADAQGREYQSFEELEWYLWRVAGVVGLATLDVVGIKGHKAEDLARELGFAVQLTNIVRDAYDDAAMGRVYLPSDLLAVCALTRQDVLQNPDADKLTRALKQTAQRAKEHYRRAGEILKTLPARKTLPCRVMGCVYGANLAKIEKTDFQFSKAVKLSKFEKLAQCLYALYKKNFVD